MVFGAAARDIMPLTLGLVDDPPQRHAADEHGAQAIAVLFAAQVRLLRGVGEVDAGARAGTAVVGQQVEPRKGCQRTSDPLNNNLYDIYNVFHGIFTCCTLNSHS